MQSLSRSTRNPPPGRAQQNLPTPPAPKTVDADQFNADMRNGIQQWMESHAAKASPDVLGHIDATVQFIEDFVRDLPDSRIQLPQGLPGEVVELLQDVAAIHGVAMDAPGGAARAEHRSPEEIKRPPPYERAREIPVAAAGSTAAAKAPRTQAIERLFQQITSSQQLQAEEARKRLIGAFGDPDSLIPNAPELNPQEAAAVRNELGSRAIACFQAHPTTAPACVVYLAGRAAHAERDRLRSMKAEAAKCERLRVIEQQAHVALDAQLQERGLRLDESNLVNRARMVADDEFAAVGDTLKNLSYKTVIDLAGPPGAALANHYDGVLMQHMLAVVETGKPAVIPIQNEGHWLTLFIVEDAANRPPFQAVLFDSDPGHRPGHAQQQLQRAFTGMGLRQLRVFEYNMQKNTPNSCGVHFQMLAQRVDGWIGSYNKAQSDQGRKLKPIDGDQLGKRISGYISEWMSASPAEQVAQVDQANMQRFQVMASGPVGR